MTIAGMTYEDFVLFNIVMTVNAVMDILLHLMRRVGFQSYNTTRASICQLIGSHQFFHHGNNFKLGQVRTVSSSMYYLH